MEAVAYVKNVKGSPRKVRIVADAVRGMNALYAIEALKYMRKGAALPVMKVVKSAVANAINNFDMPAEQLKITKIEVGTGLTYKRMRAESRGRGRRILKRNSNIFVHVGLPVVAASSKQVNEQTKVAEKAEPKAKKVSKVTEVKTKKVIKPVAKPKATVKKKVVKKDGK